ncbi:MAG: PspC domain-containing protein [Candidatus Heimdallarchaeaceae archaeon]
MIICPQCGTENPKDSQFCQKCGRQLELVTVQAQPVYHAAPEHEKKLVRCANDQMIGGVCAGFAHYSNMDVGLVRILTAIAAFLTGSIVVWLYILAWIILPEEPCPM